MTISALTKMLKTNDFFLSSGCTVFATGLCESMVEVSLVCQLVPSSGPVRGYELIEFIMARNVSVYKVCINDSTIGITFFEIHAYWS